MTQEYANFATMKVYVGSDGAEWQRRGRDVLEGKALARRLNKADVVVHHYMGTLTDVPPDARAAFWAAAESRMAESEYSFLRGFEFKDDARRHLLVIDEAC